MIGGTSPYRTVCRLGATAVVALGLSVAASAGVLDEPTALEKYVFTPDPAYGYKVTETQTYPGATVYVIVMDSLTWRNADEVDRSLWTHQLVVIVPDAILSGTAFYLINGGSDPLEPLDPLFVLAGIPIATGTGSVVAVVSQIPNQPLLFADQPAPVSEDALVAYSWGKLMDTGNAEWAAYLPMTKASVRGMDTVQQLVSEVSPQGTVADFMVTGFSKRGATAWLVAAVDPRVRAVAPGVFDVLDIPLQIERHYQAYGFYSSAVQDYVDFDIVRRGRSPEGRFLASIVDPISYAPLLTMPKLLLNSTGDEFFLPDSANFYLDRLPGETLVSQVPNTDHGFSDGLLEGIGIVFSWYESILAGQTRPQLNWWRTADGTLKIMALPAPESASLWQASNPDARDFRLETLGAAWTETPLQPAADGTFEVNVEPPLQGYTGYLARFRFAGQGTGDQTYSTPVMVTPEELPFLLDDPVGATRPAAYWRCQFPGTAGCDDPPDFTNDELQALLPFPVFGKYVTTLHTLEDLLAPASTSRARAERHCTATRLNIAVGALGWYSATGTGLLWEQFEAVENAYRARRYRLAARGCIDLNRLGEAK